MVINMLEVSLDKCFSSFIWDGGCYGVVYERVHAH